MFILVKYMNDTFGRAPSQVQFSGEKEHTFFYTALVEEIEEFNDATNKKDRLDALIDIIVFALNYIDRLGYGTDTVASIEKEYSIQRDDFGSEVIIPIVNKFYMDNSLVLSKILKSRNDKHNNKIYYYELITLANSVHTLRNDRQTLLYSIKLLINRTLAIAYFNSYKDIFAVAFKRVMKANMAKVVGKNSKRGDFEIDLIKPKGWTPPNFDDLFDDSGKDDDNPLRSGCDENQMESLLNDRAKRYGSFADNANTTQACMHVFGAIPNFASLPYAHKEVMHMIIHKLARMVCGDPMYIDNVDDIIGYATRLKEYIESEQSGEKV